MTRFVFDLAILSVAIAACGGCGGNKPLPSENGTITATDNGDAPTVQPGADPDASGSPLSMGTLPDFSLTDQTGTTVSRDDLHNRVWVANFIFTRCGSTCPRQTAQMADLQNLLSEQPAWEGIRLVSFSVEPEYDTPEVLANYARQYRADAEHWKFLTGPRKQIWDLCKDGFHLPVADDPNNTQMPIMHDSKFVLIDRLGRIRGYYDGLTQEGIEALLKDLNFVLPEFDPPPDAWAPYAEAFDQVTHLAQPPEIVTTEWLAARGDAQRSAISQAAAFHDFRFTDRLSESGITFHPQIVDEQRSRLQVNHYDHGNGVCVADVDGDGLHDLYFTTQVGRNELWKNLGGGRFEDITEQAGVALADRISVTATFADTDNDGDADLFVTSVRGGNALLINDGAGKFSDISEAAGLNFIGHSSGATFFDYDRDGLLDLLVANVGKYTTDQWIDVRLDRVASVSEGEYAYHPGIKDAFAGHLKPALTEQSILYRNKGDNRFEDVTEEMGLADDSWSGDATPIDGNGDGWFDLYVLNMQGHDQYFENVEGKEFVRKSREVFPKTSWGAMGAKSFDFNNDGAMDLFITDMHSDMSEDVGPDDERRKSNMQWPESFLRGDGNSIYGNSFFRNDGDGKFEEVSDAIGAENYWPWGLSVGDLNADGYEDAFVASSMCFPYRYGINSVLLNEAGKRFEHAEFALGIEPRRQLLKPWFELDASARDRNHPICNGRTGRIVVWSCLGSRSSVIFDLDGDGDLDIVTNEFNAPPQILVSNLTDQRAAVQYLKVNLVGQQSNRDGLGAIVRVTCGDHTYTRVKDGKSGYLSQSLLPLYFGLGDAKAIDGIEISWPSGTVMSIPGPIETNQIVEFTEES